MTLKSVVSAINSKSTTQNTEGELYVRIVKREIILNWGSGKQSPLKKHYSHSVIGDKE